MDNSEPISIRIARINNIILGLNGVENLDKDVLDGLGREGLLDALIVLYEECSKDIIKNKDKHICDFVTKYRNIVNYAKNLRINAEDFNVKCLIGKGYFGDVYLVTEKKSEDIYAMKKMRKSIEHTTQVKEERDIMANNQSEWITSLQYAFQDPEWLYLVMEYLPGGDLLSLMIRNEGPFDEDVTRFYLAEITVALNVLHKMGYVHRDVKPENILLDRFGHIKLADFGKSIQINKDGSVTSATPVGTPDYIAPELLQTVTNVKFSKIIHDVTCDFWSMGIIAYELITETTPFHDENINTTYTKIVEHCEKRNKLHYRSDVSISKDFRHLLDKLVTRSSERLTYKEIVDHPYFDCVNWNTLRYCTPPVIPKVTSNEDIRNFDDVDRTVKRRSNFLNKATFTVNKVNSFSGQNLRFLGFTYVKHSNEVFNEDNLQIHDCDNSVETIKDLKMKLNEKNDAVKRLQIDLLVVEKNFAKANTLDQVFDDTKRELESMATKLKDKCIELATTKTEVKSLKSSLKVEEDMQKKNLEKVQNVLSTTYQKWEKAKKLSDQNYEKEIVEKRSELAGFIQKLQARENEMITKIDECNHLQTTLESYKQLLKMAKEQNTIDKQEYERNRKELNEIYETKVQELKEKFKRERDANTAKSEEINLLRQEIENHVRNEQTKKRSLAEKSANDFKRRMTMQFDENHVLRQAKEAAEAQAQTLKDRCDRLQIELKQLQDEHLHLTLTSNSTSNRSSIFSSTDSEFKSANASLHDEQMSAALEEQLRNDLDNAHSTELKQRKRIDELELVIFELEEKVTSSKILKTSLKSPKSPRKSSSKTGTAEDLLERQNQKLEEQLVTARESAIVERQSARSANLALWKLEKELENALTEKKNISRKLELLEERFKRQSNEKHQAEFVVKQHDDLIAAKQILIDEMKIELDEMKQELKKQEKTRMQEKTELMECLTKVHVMEDQVDDLKRRLNVLQQQNNIFTEKNNHFSRELLEKNMLLNQENDRIFELEKQLNNALHNQNDLKEVCKIMDAQINDIESILEKESKQNQAACEKNDELWKRIRAKDDEMIKLKQDFNQEKSLKIFAESKSQQLQNELDDLKSNFDNFQIERIVQQNQMVGTTTNLFEAQEKLEIVMVELAIAKQANSNHEQQLLQLKEEKTKVLTDLYLIKEENTKLYSDLQEACEEIAECKRKFDHLKTKMSEQENYYRQKDIKMEATLAQHKKLIEYLQAKVEELQNKKKKSLADVLFGANTKKENVSPNFNEDILGNKKLQEDLKKERCRNNQLKDQLLKSKTLIRTMELKEKNDVPEQENTIVFKEQPVERNFSTLNIQPSELQPHQFQMTMDTSSKKTQQICVVCNQQVVIGQPYYNCKDCSIPVHRKCRGAVLTNCEISNNSASAELNDHLTKGAPLEKYCGDLLLSSKQLKQPVVVNTVYEINENVLLLGCDDGLYSYHYGADELVHIKGIKGVIFFGIQRTCSKAILIGSHGKILYQCELRHLENRGQASACLEPIIDVTPLDLSFTAANERWHYCSVHFDDNNAIAIATTALRVVIMKYDTTLKCFKPMRALDTAKPVTSIHFTQHTAIVASDKFFEIDLSSYAAEEFLDMSDVTLRETRKIQPMFAARINSQEFLLCFKELGIFVDEYGCRSRSDNLKWLHEPTGFEYREPMLYVTHADALQVIKIEKSFTKGLIKLHQQRESSQSSSDDDITGKIRAILSLPDPKIIGNSEKVGVYLESKAMTTKGENTFELLLIEGNRVFKSHLGISSETLTSSRSSLKTTTDTDTVSTTENYM